MKRRTSIAAWLLAGLAVAALLSLFGSHFSSARTAAERLDSPWILSWAGFPVVGALIASRRPSTRIGWVLISIGLGVGLGIGSLTLSERSFLKAGLEVPGAEYLHWLGWILFVPGFGLIPYVVMLFPTDRIASSFWRRSAYAYGALLAITTALVGLRRSYEITGGSKIPNPFALASLDRPIEAAIPIVGPALALFGAASVVHAIYRFVRARGEQRLQMKWFIYAAAMMPAVFVVGIFLEPVSLRASNVVGLIAFVVGFNAVAASIGIAVVKYRLYDIDVVINKTLVYGALAAFITAIYVGIVVGVGALIGQGDKPNLGLSLAATALVAVAFQPVRQRVQHLANRLVYGQRVSPYEAITSFTHRIAESLSFEEVLPRMAEAAAKGVGGTRASVKMFLPGGSTEAAYFPPTERANSFDRTVNVTHQGETVGEIAVAKSPGEQINEDEDKLLKDLASQAGLAMRNLRLTAELKQRLGEIEESRKRIVDAQDQERRRMERDIHDGAQRQLIEMVERLGIAKSQLERDPLGADQMLEELKSETGRVVETVRDLARGIFPPLLSDRGLGPALDSLVQKLPLPVSIEKQSLDGVRFDQEAETAIYFCMRELLQDAVRGGLSSAATARIWVEDGSIAFEIQNAPAGESTLQNMFDRIEALGGTLSVDSQTDRRTRVSGAIPARVREAVA